MESIYSGERNSEIELRLLIEAIYLKYSYDFRDYSGASIKRRVHHALTQFECATISALQEKVLHDPTAFMQLLQLLTIPVSEMFRDPSHFLAIRQEVVPLLKTARSRDKVFEGRKVLLVDDDVRNIFALTSALEQKGAVVIIGRNGFEAIDRLNEVEDIDLVLMDVMMPEMDGFEATTEIRKDPRWRKLPIIAVTAKAMKDDQERCLQAGSNDYLAKPIDLDRLFSLIRVWLPKMERI